MNKRLLRYHDLVALGIVNNRMTLQRWQHAGKFPMGFLLAANTRVWDAEEVEIWLADQKATRSLPVTA